MVVAAVVVGARRRHTPVEDVGERTTVRFAARPSFREYYCDYHPTSMRGMVAVVE